MNGKSELVNQEKAIFFFNSTKKKLLKLTNGLFAKSSPKKYGTK